MVARSTPVFCWNFGRSVRRWEAQKCSLLLLLLLPPPFLSPLQAWKNDRVFSFVWGVGDEGYGSVSGPLIHTVCRMRCCCEKRTRIGNEKHEKKSCRTIIGYNSTTVQQYYSHCLSFVHRNVRAREKKIKDKKKKEGVLFLMKKKDRFCCCRRKKESNESEWTSWVEIFVSTAGGVVDYEQINSKIQKDACCTIYDILIRVGLVVFFSQLVMRQTCGTFQRHIMSLWHFLIGQYWTVRWDYG